ncbi:MAG: hypothetical protein ACP5UI_01720 [Thermoprotei archaeon]|nr:hypothetical protein [TACK group archaeon]
MGSRVVVKKFGEDAGSGKSQTPHKNLFMAFLQFSTLLEVENPTGRGRAKGAGI